MSPSGVETTNEPGAVPGTHAGRRRILQVCGSAAGGVRAHLADCARLLAADGHDVIVEAPAAVLDTLDVEPARAEALEIGPRPSLNDSLAVARLRRLGRRADVVHAHGLRAGALAALALAALALVSPVIAHLALATLTGFARAKNLRKLSCLIKHAVIKLPSRERRGIINF